MVCAWVTRGEVVSATLAWRYWLRSPCSRYSTNRHRGSCWVHTPTTPTMWGSRNLANICTSLSNPHLKKVENVTSNIFIWCTIIQLRSKMLSWNSHSGSNYILYLWFYSHVNKKNRPSMGFKALDFGLRLIIPYNYKISNRWILIEVEGNIIRKSQNINHWGFILSYVFKAEINQSFDSRPFMPMGSETH